MAGVCVLYLAVGDSVPLHRQALYAGMSALAWGDGTERVVLYTNHPEEFVRIAPCITIEPIPQSLAEKYLDRAFDPFQLKLTILGHAAEIYPQQALLFCDADTFFTCPYHDLAARLQSGAHFLHRREYSIASHPTPQMRKFKKALRKAGLGGETGTAMWNSGVVGLPPPASAVLRDAQTIFTQVSAHTRKRYLAEQFALSLAIDRAGTLSSAEDWVFHYWFQKDDYTRSIKSFLSMYASTSLADLLTLLRQQRLTLPPPRPKLHWWETALIRTGLRNRPEEIRGLPK